MMRRLLVLALTVGATISLVQSKRDITKSTKAERIRKQEIDNKSRGYLGDEDGNRRDRRRAAREEDGVELMSAYAEERGLQLFKCQEDVDLVVVLDNSQDIMQTELLGVKMWLAELAKALLWTAQGSRIGIILTTDPQNPLISWEENSAFQITEFLLQIAKIKKRYIPGYPAQTLSAAYNMVKNNMRDDVMQTLLWITGPFGNGARQVPPAIEPYIKQFVDVQRLAVGFRVTSQIETWVLQTFVGCTSCDQLQIIPALSPISFAMSLKTLYGFICVKCPDRGDKTYITFNLEDMTLADFDVNSFLTEFVQYVSSYTGIPNENINPIDITDSTGANYQSSHGRRLKQVADYQPKRKLFLDVLLTELPQQHPAKSTRSVAMDLQRQLNNSQSGLADLFQKRWQGIPQIQEINLKDRLNVNTNANLHSLYPRNGPFQSQLFDL